MQKQGTPSCKRPFPNLFLHVLGVLLQAFPLAPVVTLLVALGLVGAALPRQAQLVFLFNPCQQCLLSALMNRC